MAQEAMQYSRALAEKDVNHYRMGCVWCLSNAQPLAWSPRRGVLYCLSCGCSGRVQSVIDAVPPEKWPKRVWVDLVMRRGAGQPELFITGVAAVSEYVPHRMLKDIETCLRIANVGEYVDEWLRQADMECPHPTCSSWDL